MKSALGKFVRDVALTAARAGVKEALTQIDVAIDAVAKETSTPPQRIKVEVVKRTCAHCGEPVTESEFTCTKCGFCSVGTGGKYP